MVPEADQPAPAARDQAGPAAGQAKTASKLRAGVPVWRTGKPDAFLAAAVDTARAAIEGITAPSDIGRHVAAKSEGDRLVTHLFESKLPGYVGWQWFAVLTRNSRSKVVTVSELGLLPSEDSILAPEWVPWAERVRPEDAQEQDDLEQEVLEQEVLEQDAPEQAAQEQTAEQEASGLEAEGEGPVQQEGPAQQEGSVQQEGAAASREDVSVGDTGAGAADADVTDAAAQDTGDDAAAH